MPTKIGVLSDIHGNIDALISVLNDAQLLGVSRLFILGDIVGYYYYPDLVIDLLRKWPLDIIKGNHEKILEDLDTKKISKVSIKKKYGSGHDIALKKINEKYKLWLYSLPYSKSVCIDKISFQLNHGSPWCFDTYIYKDSSPDVINRCDSLVHDFVLIGHSHYAFSIINENSILINCGSVGQSREKGGIANWAIIDTADKSYKLQKSQYDVSKLVKEIEEIDPDVPYLKKVLTR